MSEYEEYEDYPSLEQEIEQAHNDYLNSLKNPNWTNKSGRVLDRHSFAPKLVRGESSISGFSFWPGEKWVVDDVNSVRFLR